MQAPPCGHAAMGAALRQSRYLAATLPTGRDRQTPSAAVDFSPQRLGPPTTPRGALQTRTPKPYLLGATRRQVLPDER